MDIAKRIKEAEQKYETKQRELASLNKQVEECNTEMVKLQGEWRVLNQLKDSEPKKGRRAGIIEVPEATA